MHFRYYAWSIGRFAKPDAILGSILSPQSLNRYAYCRNNPVNLIDPLGLENKEPEKPTPTVGGNNPGGPAPGSPMGRQCDDSDPLEGYGAENMGSPDDAKGGGWGGGGSNQLPTIHLKIPVYFDNRLGLDEAGRAKWMSKIRVNLLSDAIQAFGPMGILIDVYDAGNIDLEWGYGWKIVTDPKHKIKPRSLNIIITNYGRMMNGHKGLTTLIGIGKAKKKAMLIFIRTDATSHTLYEELGHAIGVGISHWVDNTPIENLELWMIKKYHIRKDYIRRNAAKYE